MQNTMIDYEMRSYATSFIDELLNKAKCSFPILTLKSYPTIKWTLRGGTVAGTAKPEKWEVLLHPGYYKKYGQKYLDRTVVHEIAHLITYAVYGRVKPHGKEWKYVMKTLGVKNIKRCHNYDPTGLVNRMKKEYVYSCNCDENYNFTKIRHRKALNHMEKYGKHLYSCRFCKSDLQYVCKR